MRTLKPRTLTVLNAPFQHDGKVRLVLVVGAMVSLDGASIEQEQTLWKSCAALPGANGLLDELKPKVRGEALLSGFAFAPQGASPRPSCRAARRGRRRQGGVGDRRSLLEADRADGGRALRRDAAHATIAPSAAKGTRRTRAARATRRIKDEAGNAVHPLPNLELAKKLVTSPRERPPIAGFAPDRRRAAAADEEARHLRPEVARDALPRDGRGLRPHVLQRRARRPVDRGLLAGRRALRAPERAPRQAEDRGRRPELHRAVLRDPRAGPTDAFEDIALRCDTLWFLPHEERVILVFRGGHRRGRRGGVGHRRRARRARAGRASRGPSSTTARCAAAAWTRAAARCTRCARRTSSPATSASRDPPRSARWTSSSPREDLVRTNQRRRAERELAAARARFERVGRRSRRHCFRRSCRRSPRRPRLTSCPRWRASSGDEARRRASSGRRRLQRLREACEKVGIDFDATMAGAKSGGGPPKFSAEEHVAHTRGLLAEGEGAGRRGARRRRRRSTIPAFLESLRKAETADAGRVPARRAPHAAGAIRSTRPEAAALRAADRGGARARRRASRAAT